MNPQLLLNDTSPKGMLSNLTRLRELPKFDSKRRLLQGRIKRRVAVATLKRD